MRRYLTERLRDPGSNRALCSAPPPPVVGGGDDDDVDWMAHGLLSSDDGSIVARGVDASLVVGVVVTVGGRRGGGQGGSQNSWQGRGGRVSRPEGTRRVGRGSARAGGEEGGSGGVWARDGVPRAGGELWSGG